MSRRSLSPDTSSASDPPRTCAMRIRRRARPTMTADALRQNRLQYANYPEIALIWGNVPGE